MFQKNGIKETVKKKTKRKLGKYMQKQKQKKNNKEVKYMLQVNKTTVEEKMLKLWKGAQKEHWKKQVVNCSVLYLNEI